MTDVPSWWTWLILACLAVFLVSVLTRLVVVLLSRRAGGRSGGPSLLRAIGAPSLVAASLVLAGGLAATMVAAPALQGQYSSRALVALEPRDPIGTDADTVLLLGPSYLSRLKSPTVLDEASARAGIAVDDLRDGADVLVEPSTTILQSDYSSSSADEAAQGAQSLAGAFITTVRDDELVRPRPLGPAVAPLERSEPSLELLLIFGGLASLALAVVVGAAVGQRVRA